MKVSDMAMANTVMYIPAVTCHITPGRRDSCSVVELGTEEHQHDLHARNTLSMTDLKIDQEPQERVPHYIVCDDTGALQDIIHFGFQTLYTAI